jgi:signal transduction histidine kinase
MDKKINILILDDSKTINNSLKKNFLEEQMGLEILQAFCIEDAKKIIKGSKIDYLILDLELPDGSGEEVLEELDGTIKTIVLTSSTDLSTRDELFRSGAIDYFNKRERIDYLSRDILLLIKKLENNHNYTVLVADDSTIARKKSINSFKLRNYNVLEACNGQEALDIIHSNDIDLLILDLEMPVVNGEEVLLSIRRGGNRDLPIVVISGSSDRDLISRVLKYGANEFLQKPYSLEELYLRSSIAFEQGFANKRLRDINNNLKDIVQKEVKKNIEQEKLLIQKARNAVMGEMMANIIHQWKQPISTLYAYCSSASLKLSLGEEMSKDDTIKFISNIEEQIKYMNSTMNDFSDFFRPHDKKEFSINSAIEKVISILQKSYMLNSIKIVNKTKDDLYSMGHQNEIMQVLMNLFNNARDAIVENDSEYKIIEIEALKDDSNILISVTDYAGGIKEDIIDRVFEAYFTTKSDSDGTGIGLDMAKTIIEKNGGSIDVENIHKGSLKGARFNIRLQSI